MTSFCVIYKYTIIFILHILKTYITYVSKENVFIYNSSKQPIQNNIFTNKAMFCRFSITNVYVTRT